MRKEHELLGSLERMIQAGPVGRRLPSERRLAATFGMPRARVRKVLNELEARELIHTRAQAGSFVRAKPGPATLHALVHLLGRTAARCDHAEA